MVDRELTPSHHERPSPDEPWRFACPDCGSSAVDSLARSRIRGGHDEFNFYCQNCHEKLVAIIDKQTDSKIYSWGEVDDD